MSANTVCRWFGVDRFSQYRESAPKTSTGETASSAKFWKSGNDLMHRPLLPEKNSRVKLYAQ